MPSVQEITRTAEPHGLHPTRLATRFHGLSSLPEARWAAIALLLFAVGGLAQLAGAPALLWWRFYTFYIYIVLGALAAGRTAIRALKKRDELEDELEKGED